MPSWPKQEGGNQIGPPVAGEGLDFEHLPGRFLRTSRDWNKIWGGILQLMV